MAWVSSLAGNQPGDAMGGKWPQQRDEEGNESCPGSRRYLGMEMEMRMDGGLVTIHMYIEYGVLVLLVRHPQVYTDIDITLSRA